MQIDEYASLIDTINEKYGTTTEVEHQFIHEFFDGEFPVFKLIYGKPNEANDPIVVVSFHLEINVPHAISWYLRLIKLDPHLHITGCYLKDEYGTSYVGADAEMLRMHYIEQSVISAWLQANPQKEQSKREKPQPNSQKSFTDYGAALSEFDKMDSTKKKNSTFH